MTLSPRKFLDHGVTTVRSRTGIVLFATIATSVIRVGSSIVLTRLLNAEVFGVVGVLTTINVIFALLTDLGFFQYVIRQSNYDSAAMLDEVWTIRLIRSIVLVLAIACASPLIAGYVNMPDLAPAIIATSLVILAEGLSSMAFATAPRADQLARLSLLDLVPYCVQVTASVILAWLFRNYWSIVLAMVIAAAVRVTISYLLFSNSGRRIVFSKSRTADVWKFGRFVVAATLINLILSQADKIVFARYFPIAQFGVYILAANIATMPAQFVSSYVERILYPAFCQANERFPKHLKQAYYNTGRPVRLFYMIGAGGFIGCAPTIIALLYDPRYQDAARFLTLLSVGMLVRMPAAAANQFLMSIGRPAHLLGLNVIRLVAFLGCAAIGIFTFGPIGLLAGVIGMDATAQCYCWIALKRVNAFDWRQESLYVIAGGLGVGLGLVVNLLVTPFRHLF